VESPEDHDLAKALPRAAATLGLTDDPDPDAHDEDEGPWTRWLSDARLLAAVQNSVREVSTEQRSATWTSWWRSRYTLSVAYLTLAALSALCPGVDTDELLVDLSPHDGTVFWLSEPSPGGTGHIEAFHRVLAQDPEAFTRALDDALSPSAAETMDEELTVLLRCADPEVRSSLEELRTAWRAGHSAVSRAVARLRESVLAQNLTLGGPARSALSTRLAGPGAHPSLLTEVASWLDLRDRAADRAGIEVGARTLGALLADDDRLDKMLHLGDGVTPQRRARAVSNVLWPWGQSAQATLSYNPYGRQLQASIPTVREHVDLRPTAVDVVPWDDDRRSALHEVLLEQREVILRARHADRLVLRMVILDLQTRPVEVGALLCHPVVVGIRRSVHFVEAFVLLREAP
jgi:hypothetical protein